MAGAKREFAVLRNVCAGSVAYPACYFIGTPRIKEPAHATHQSSPSGVEIMTVWSYISILQCAVPLPGMLLIIAVLISNI